MKQKAARILAIIALVFMGVFTVTLIMAFINFGNPATTIIAIVSVSIGLVLFLTMKFLMKEPKVNAEPEVISQDSSDGNGDNESAIVEVGVSKEVKAVKHLVKHELEEPKIK